MLQKSKGYGKWKHVKPLHVAIGQLTMRAYRHQIALEGQSTKEGLGTDEGFVGCS